MRLIITLTFFFLILYASFVIRKCSKPDIILVCQQLCDEQGRECSSASLDGHAVIYQCGKKKLERSMGRP